MVLGQLPFWEHTNISLHRTKVICLAELAHYIYDPLLYILTDQSVTDSLYYQVFYLSNWMQN